MPNVLRAAANVGRLAAHRGWKTVRKITDRFAPLMYRVSGEAIACPACASPRIRLIQTLSLSREVGGRRVGFVSGCTACGLVFANPLPGAATLEDFYSPAGPWGAGRQAGAIPERPPAYVDRIFEAVRDDAGGEWPPDDPQVLDFGCGGGGFLDALQDRGWHTTGIDPS